VRTFVAVILAAAVVRGCVLIVLSANLQADPDMYRSLAENLRNEGVYGRTFETRAGPRVAATAYRPPLYPLVLSVFVVDRSLHATAVAAFHFATGLATVAVVYAIAVKWRAPAPWLAAVLTACDPMLLNQSSLVMTETLATFLAACALLAMTYLCHRRSVAAALMCGACLGLACLCRPVFLPWAAVCVLLVCLLHGAWPQRLRCALAMAVAATLVVAPWPIRCAVVVGRPVIATTHGGYTLLLGNNPGFYRYIAGHPLRGGVWDARELNFPPSHPYTSSGRFDRTGKFEFREDAAATRQARANIARQPVMAVYACVVRVARLWRPVPYQTSRTESWRRTLARYAAGAWCCLLFVAAATGVYRHGRQCLRGPFLCALCMCIVFTAVHAIYWSNIRMRAPLMPAVCIAASLAAGRRR